MRYKSEVLYKRKVIFAKFHRNNTHPNQVVANTFKSLQKKPDNIQIYVMNEVGDYWRYNISLLKDGKYHVKKMEKSNHIISKNDVDMIMAGNKNIAG